MKTYDFELIEQREITELNCECFLYRHKITGTEFLSIKIDDENKVFGISFKTLPEDSTGVAHIIEHAVLAGSEKYQVKEPFIELNKGSLKTFVNAFTYSDKTVYPVASTNTQDLFNLIDVYMDAVLHPLLPEHILAQEGWHLELDNLDQPLKYKGVVFNEMKGALSNPLSNLFDEAQKGLFPQNLYQYNAGGDPREIPNLTYQQFKDFHKKFYHPSNSRLYWYGDDNLEKRLMVMSEYFKGYSAQAEIEPIPLQEKFDQPRKIVGTYPAGEGETKSMLLVNWLLPENAHPYLNLSLDVLSHILIGTQASPLRKALIDSGYGEDTIGGGISDHLKQLYFATGLKGVTKKNIPLAEKLIEETLMKLVEEGIDPEMIASTMNTLEFRLREQNTGSFPRGLFVMLAGLSTWLYGHNPLDGIEYQASLDRLKVESQKPGFFENLIKTHLLDNQHRVTVLMQPDSKLIENKEKQEEEKLAALKLELSEDQLIEIQQNTIRLKEIQETPDKPEDLEKIPSLALSDLDKNNKLIPRDVQNYHGAQIIKHDLFTNGILYLNLGFDLHSVSKEDIPYLGLFANGLVRLGTKNRDYVQLSQWIGRETGGVGASLTVQPHKHNSESSSWLLVRGKATIDKVGELTSIMEEILSSALFSNKERFKQIVLETKAGFESSFVSAGHSYVNRRLGSKFNESGWVGEQIYGVSQFLFLKQLLEEMESDWEAVQNRLEGIRTKLLCKSKMVVDMTATQDEIGSIRESIHHLIDSCSDNTPKTHQWDIPIDEGNEGLSVPSQVNYVGKGANLFKWGYQLDGSISVIQNYVRTTYLWEKIRIQGGAYGAFMSFSPFSGVMNLLSYRDPNLMETIFVFDGMGEFLRSLKISENELTKSIIGSIGQMDAYQLPDAKGYTSLSRYLSGYSDDDRQVYREQLLGTKIDDFNRFAEAMDTVKNYGKIVILASNDALLQTNQEKQDWLKILTIQ